MSFKEYFATPWRVAVKYCHFLSSRDRPRPGLPRVSPRPHTEALGTRLHSSLPPRRQQFWKVSPENFFWQLGHNPKKSGKFLSGPLIFSFPYAHGCRGGLVTSRASVRKIIRAHVQVYKYIVFKILFSLLKIISELNYKSLRSSSFPGNKPCQFQSIVVWSKG
jgi:hypothetical protein